jgi:hypothetical protein
MFPHFTAQLEAAPFKSAAGYAAQNLRASVKG